MPFARKEHICDKEECGGVIPVETWYAKKGSKKYHRRCAPEGAEVNDRMHYPTARRAMKKILHTGSVRGFFR